MDGTPLGKADGGGAAAGEEGTNWKVEDEDEAEDGREGDDGAWKLGEVEKDTGLAGSAYDDATSIEPKRAARSAAHFDRRTGGSAEEDRSLPNESDEGRLAPLEEEEEGEKGPLGTP